MMPLAALLVAFIVWTMIKGTFKTYANFATVPSLTPGGGNINPSAGATGKW